LATPVYFHLLFYPSDSATRIGKEEKVRGRRRRKEKKTRQTPAIFWNSPPFTMPTMMASPCRRWGERGGKGKRPREEKGKEGTSLGSGAVLLFLVCRLCPPFMTKEKGEKRGGKKKKGKKRIPGRRGEKGKEECPIYRLQLRRCLNGLHRRQLKKNGKSLGGRKGRKEKKGGKEGITAFRNCGAAPRPNLYLCTRKSGVWKDWSREEGGRGGKCCVGEERKEKEEMRRACSTCINSC